MIGRTAGIVLIASTLAFAQQDHDQAAAPSGITLHFDRELVGKAFDVLGRKAKVTFIPPTPGYWARSKRRVTLDCKDASYWQAVGDLCSEAHLFPISAKDLQVDLHEDLIGWGHTPFAIVGPFRVHMLDVLEDASGAYTRSPHHPPGNSIRFAIYGEPHTHVGYVRRPEVQELIDQDGHPIPYHNPRGMPAYRNCTGYAEILPEVVVSRIRLLKATLFPVLVTQFKPLEISAILNANNRSMQFGDLQLSVTTTGKDNTYQVEILFEYEGHDMPFWSDQREALVHLHPHLADAQGRQYEMNSWGHGFPADRAISDSFSFPIDAKNPNQPGPPVRFFVDIPTAFQVFPVPVQFKDLPPL